MLQPQPQYGQMVSTAVMSQQRPSPRLRLSCRAPVGQEDTQLPHISQSVSTMERPKEVVMYEGKPRSAKSSTWHICTSLQMPTQRPHRMHLDGS